MARKSHFVPTIRFFDTPLLGTAMLVLICAMTGCRSTSTISALELPMSYRVTDVTYGSGVDLSALSASTFDNEVVYPGDSLNITVITGAELEMPEPTAYQVGKNGDLVLPLVGAVKVGGLRFDEAELAIRQASVDRRIFANPTVTVSLEARQMNRVQVVGAVNKQGIVELPKAGSDILAAISAAEGLAKEAGTSIEVRRSGQQTARKDENGVMQVSYEDGPESVAHIDLLDIDPNSDFQLGDGAVVMVKPKREQTVYVRGLVKEAGKYDIPEDEPLRVTQAIALAGGLTTEIADKVYLTRYVDGQTEPVVVHVSLKEANTESLANPVLKAGDEVYVLETPTTFTVEFLRQFFRFGFSSSFPGL